jgi:hypothetical protein
VFIACVGGIPPALAGQVREAGVTPDQEVRVTAAEGRHLVEEALAQDKGKIVSLTLQPGANAFRVEGARVVLLATAQSGPLACPVRISGVPAIRTNLLVLTAPDITTTGMMCNGALDLLRQKSLEALASHPWDLAVHLAQASVNASHPPRSAPPGARLPAPGPAPASDGPGPGGLSRRRPHGASARRGRGLRLRGLAQGGAEPRSYARRFHPRSIGKRYPA